MIVLTNEPMTPTSFSDVLEVARREEFKALIKIINDLGVELRLLAALAGKQDLVMVSSQEMLDIYKKYEDATWEIVRKTTMKLRG